MTEIRPDLLLRETAWLHRLARALVGPEQAEDLAQGTLLRALRHCGRSVASPRAWLARIARNLARSLRRREARRAAVEGRAGSVSQAPATDEVVARACLHRAMVEAVLELDEPYRTAVLLRYLRELPVAEVADRTGITAAAARTRIKRGLAILRARLAARREFWMAMAPVALPAAAISASTGLPLMTAKAKLAIAAALLMAAFSIWQLLPGTGAPLPGRTGTAARATGEADAVASELAESLARAPATGEDRGGTPQPPVPEARLRGLLLDEENRGPVVGALVQLVDRGGEETGEAVATATARSDAFGTFELRTERRLLARGYRAELVVEAAGHARIRQVVKRGLARSADRLDIGIVTLPPGTGVRGTVVDQEGAPVAGAALLVGEDWVWFQDVGRRLRGDRLRLAGESAADGSFALAHRLAGSDPEPLLVAVGRDGLGWVSLPVRRARHEIDELVLPLRPAARLTVRVQSPAGSPVPGATVRVQPRFPPFAAAMVGAGLFPRRGPWAEFFHRRTGADGQAEFAGLPGDAGGRRYWLFVEAAGFGPARLEQVVVAGPAATADVVLQPLRPLAITGSVRDASGRPLPGALVEAGFGSRASARSDDQGRYRLEVLPGTGGLLELRVSAVGHASILRFEEVDSGAESVTFDFTLQPAGEIRGQVVDQFGAPVAGAGILCEPGRGNARTDAEGRFRIAGQPQTDLELWVEPPPPVDAWAGDLVHTARPGDGPLLLVLERLESGRGTVDVEVEVVDRDSGRPREVADAWFYWRDGSGGRVPLAPRVELGRIAAGGLRPGRWELDASIAGGPPLLLALDLRADRSEVRRRIEVGGGADLEVAVRFALPPGDAPPEELELGFVPLGNRGRIEPLPGTALRQASRHGATLRVDSASPRFAVRQADPSRPLELRVLQDGYAGRVIAELAEGVTRHAELVVRQAGRLLLTSAYPFPHRGLRLSVQAAGRPWDEPVWIAGTHGRTELFSLSVPPGPLRWRVELPTRGATNRGPPPVLEGAVEIPAGAEVRVPLLR